MILVIGGTGRLGRLVVRRLLADGHGVRVLAKGAAAATDLREAGAELVAADIRDRDAVRTAVQDVDVVVSAAHGMTGTGDPTPATVDRDGNRNVVDAASAAGAAVVLLSVVGAAPDSRMELIRMKWEAEEYLRASGVPWTVVRGTAYAEMWADLLRESARRSGRPQVFGSGRNPLNFVAVADVAAAVVRAATDPSLRGHVVEVGGPDNLTFDELAALVCPGTRPRHVPRTALRVMGVAARPFNAELARLARSAVHMDTVPVRFDAAAGHAAYPWLPSTPVTDGASIR